MLNKRFVNYVMLCYVMYVKIFYPHFESKIENNDILNKEQIGFEKRCRTSDHIFVLKTLIDQYKKTRFLSLVAL